MIDEEHIRKLADAATEGPWEADYSEENNYAIKSPGTEWGDGYAYVGDRDNAEFIAAARTAVPQLLDQLDAAEARIRHLEDTARVLVKEALEAEDKRDNHRRAKVEAEEKIKAVRELHEPQMEYRLIDGEDFAQEPDGDVCVVCREYYPCDTILALDAARRDEEKR